MRKHPPIYRENHQIMVKELTELTNIVDEISGYAPGDLMTKLRDAVTRVEEACVATRSITKGVCEVGVGVGKVEKAIACDTAIAILRQIKSIKAW